MATKIESGLAAKIAKLCFDDVIYYTGSADPIDPHLYYVRFFAVSATNHKLTGLWQLLSEAELAELEVERRPVTGGGLVWSLNLERVKKPGERHYGSPYALIRAAADLIGKPHAEVVGL